MKKTIAFILSIIAMNTGLIHGQVISDDFQYSSSITESLFSPTRIAVDHLDNLYVTDAYSRNIKKYDGSGNLLSVFTIDGIPLSVAVDNNGSLFTGDARTGKIFKVNADGSSTVFYSESLFPNCMSFSPDNLLYVADSKLGKVLVINTNGTLIQTLGEGTLIFPTGISFDSKNNRILVGEHGADNDNIQTRVYIYAPDGSLLNVIGSYGNGNGNFYRVQGVTAGRCGNIYVCEPFQGNISVFKENGTFLTKFAQFGLENGKLNIPIDIVFDSQENIWISSMNNGSVEKFTIQDPLPSAAITSSNTDICVGQSTDIEIKLTGTPPWSLTYTLNGQNPVTINSIDTSPYYLNVTQAGTYVVTALSDAFISGNCFSGSATITVNPQPTAMFTVSSLVLCEGIQAEIPVVFTGDSPWEITYTKDGNNPVTISNIVSNPYLLHVSQSGIYQITGFQGSLCEGIILQGTAEVAINNAPVAAFNYYAHNLTVDLYNTSANATYCLWNFGDHHTSNQLNPIHTYSHSGTYIVTLSTWNEYCRGDKMKKTISVNGSSDTSAVYDPEYIKYGMGQNRDFQLELYPNPSSGFFALTMVNAPSAVSKLCISNITGQILLEKIIESSDYGNKESSYTEWIDISRFTSGVYAVKVTSEEQTVITRLVLNKQ